MISAVIIAKNEEKNIEACVKTLGWVDEVIVVDDNSTDKTVEIARKNGARVYKHALDQDFAAQRNFGIEKTNGEWVLFVDADERIPPTLRAEIQLTIESLPDSRKNPQLAVNGFYLKREDEMWGKVLKHGETANVRLLRFGRKSRGEWERPVHEVWNIRGKVGELKSPLLHYPHQTLSEFLTKINFYSTIRAKELYDQNKKTNLFEVIVYPIGKFFQNFILQFGFLDGMQGFIVALLMSFHSFLVKSKLFLLWRQEGGWR